LVQEWGPHGPQAQFTLFPAVCSSMDMFTFVDRFVLAVVVYLGLAQRWNRKGLLIGGDGGGSRVDDDDEYHNSTGSSIDHDDHVVWVILSKKDKTDDVDGRPVEILGAAEYSWQPKDQTAFLLALPPSVKQWRNLLIPGRSIHEPLVPYISNVIVSPLARGQGIGKRLIHAVEDEALRSWRNRRTTTMTTMMMTTTTAHGSTKNVKQQKQQQQPPPPFQLYLHVSQKAIVAQNMYDRLGYQPVVHSPNNSNGAVDQNHFWSRFGKRLGLLLLGLYFMEPEPLEYRCKKLFP
jgi:GNAT superfamily N-acetyltransferase